MENNIKKDYFWNTLGVFLQNAISPLLLVVVTRVNGIYDSGLFSFAFSVAIIFWAVGMWGGRTYQVSDVKKEFTHRSYIMVRLILAVLVFIGAVVFSIANQYDPLKTGVILSLVLFKIIESIADVLHGILQVHNRLFIVGKALTYKAIGGFFAFVVIDIVTRDILLSSLSVVAVNVLITLLYDVRISRGLEPINLKTLLAMRYVREALEIMKRCTPVFIVVFLAMFSLNIPRYFIDLYHEEQNGYFGIIAMPVTLIVLLMTFILQPNVVGLSRLLNKGKPREFNRIARKIISATFIIGLGVFIASLAIGVPALHLIFNIDFSDYKLALMIMIAGGVINALVGVFINLFIIMRRFKAQFYILLFTNILLAVCSIFIVKTNGLVGGVSLFAATNVIQLVLFMILYNVILRLNNGKN